MSPGWFGPLLTLLAGLVKLALAIVEFLEKRDMREEAQAKVGDDVDELAKKLGKQSAAARAAVSHDADSVLHDPHNRDNLPSPPGGEPP